MNTLYKIIVIVGLALFAGHFLSAQELAIQKARFALEAACASANIAETNAKLAVDKAAKFHQAGMFPTSWKSWMGSWAKLRYEVKGTDEYNLAEAQAGLEHIKAQENLHTTMIAGVNDIRHKEKILMALENPTPPTPVSKAITHATSFFSTWKGSATLAAAIIGGYMLWNAGSQGLSALAQLDLKGFWQAFKHNGQAPQSTRIYRPAVSQGNVAQMYAAHVSKKVAASRQPVRKQVVPAQKTGQRAIVQRKVSNNRKANFGRKRR